MTTTTMMMIMSRNQRGLVDTCFEEGQYQSALALLDQLRSPSFRPPADHIRQLLFLALFPPQEHAPPSPAMSPTKQRPVLAKASLTPSPADSAAAQRLLLSFLGTNSPDALFAALPRYPLGDLPSDNDHDDDSLIAQESLSITNAKDCWALLKSGFIQCKNLLPRDARRKRGKPSYDVDDPGLVQDRGTPVLVVDHAWPVLQWLLCLFENDELIHSQRSGEKCSLLLVSQIPPPRGGTGPRWDAAAPLDIVFHSVTQQDGERREMASRLLTLLIHLGLSDSFDGLMFATMLTTRLYTSSPKIAQALMESLPKTLPVLTFKITVCQRFLSSAPSAAGTSKPRPRPLPKRGPRLHSEITPSTTDADTGRPGSSVLPRPVPTTCSDIFQLLSSDHLSQKPALTPPVLAIKYVLLMSYAHLQGLLPLGERDSEWQDALSNGGLKRVIDIAFPRDSTYHRPLTIIAGFWSAG